MQVVSLNVGKPQSFQHNGKSINTSIFKYPVTGARAVSSTNIEGDEQSDLTNHGGELKAVYSYDVSYYEHWKNVLSRNNWNHGLFGENLTTVGLPDDAVFVGSIYQIGSVYLRAVQPRFPCYKLNIRFDKTDMLHLFTQQEMNGTYFSVHQPGRLQTGDEITLVEQSKHKITINQLVKAYYTKGSDREIVDQILDIEFLPERLRKSFLSFKN